MSTPAKRTDLDGLPPVTEDEALEFCVHHLALAAIYFMNVSEDLELNLQEAERIVRTYQNGYGGPALDGIKAFLQHSHEAHEKLKR